MIMMNRETAVIRECFPPSVLLGSIERPVEPQVVVVVVVVVAVGIVMCLAAGVGPCEGCERFYDTLMFHIVKFIIFAV